MWASMRAAARPAPGPSPCVVVTACKIGIVENAVAAHGVEGQALHRQARAGRQDHRAFHPVRVGERHLQRLLAAERTAHHSLHPFDAKGVQKAHVQVDPVAHRDHGEAQAVGLSRRAIYG